MCSGSRGGDGESLTVSRMRPHYIEAVVKTRAAVTGNDPMRLFFFEVYWN